MFENENFKDVEQARSRALLVVGAIGALVLTALIVMLARTKPESVSLAENMVRTGAPEFESYKDKVELEVIEKVVHPNMIGMLQLEVRAKLHNRGDRVMTGVEILGKMFDLGDKIIARNVSIPIPRVRKEPLKPGESRRISVKVDAPGRVSEAEIKDITIELQGLRFQ